MSRTLVPARRTTSGARRSLLAAGLAALLALAGCSAFRGADAPEPSPVGSPAAVADDPAQDPALGAFYGQRLQWTGCQGGFQCSRLKVPVDYADPAGATTTLALVRLPTSAQGADRLGSLVLNPGGPGGSGIEYARGAASVVSDQVRAHFDVVGFDPRGVGTSDPLQCLPDDAVDTFLTTDPTPDDPAEVARLEDEGRALGKGCQAAGELAAHVDTRSVARDLDVLRAALGDAKLSYLGKSYGTYIGALYAQAFPARVGRVVLDGVIDPALTSDEVNAGQAAGFEQALRAYVADCLAGDACPLRGSVDDGVAQIQQLLARTDDAPLRTGTDRPLTEGLTYLALAYPLYARPLWPDLSSALIKAFAGDGSAMLTLADAYAQRRPNGSFEDNANTVIYAVNCLDRPDTDTPADVERIAADLSRTSPTFGRFLAWGSLPCTTWPIPPVGTPGPVTAEGAGPILVVGTTRDPATPYAWAQSVARELSSGHLLTYDGDGHTAYRLGSACVDAAVDTYLLAGTPPQDGARC